MTVLATLPLARLSTALLLAAVKDVCKAIPTRPSVPILTGLRLHQLSNGMLEIAAFNYELAVTRRVPVDGEIGGDVLLPSALLRTALQRLDSKQDCHLTMEGDTFVVTQNRKRVTIKPMDLDEYPALPPVPEVRDFTVPGAHLNFIGSKVAMFASRDDMLPALTGVRLEVDSDALLTAFATDRYRLAVAEFYTTMAMATSDNEFSALVPEMPLIGTLFKDARNVAVTKEEERVTFHSDETTVTVRELDGESPRVRQLFPDRVDLIATVEPAGFVNAIKFAEAALERNTPVVLNVVDDTVTVSGSSGEDTFSDTVPAKVTGLDDLKMGFNPGYLTDAIKVWGKVDEVTIGVTTNSRPAVFTSPSAENLRVLLMPVRLNR